MSDRLMQFDETASRRLLRTYLTPDVMGQRRRVTEVLAPRPGERILDIGCGPGLMAAELAAAVGAGGRVDGVDPSPSMLAIAIARGHPPAPASAPLGFSAGDAEAIPFPDDGFDAAVSTQVYEYVADIPRALAEARRVLRPGGRIAILDTDWDSIVWHSSDPGRMQRVLGVWDEHLADPHLPRRLPGALTAGGFTDIRCEVIPLLNVGYATETFSAGLIELIARFVAGRGDVTAEEAAGWAEDLRTRGGDYFFSLNRYLFVAVG